MRGVPMEQGGRRRAFWVYIGGASQRTSWRGEGGMQRLPAVASCGMGGPVTRTSSS